MQSLQSLLILLVLNLLIIISAELGNIDARKTVTVDPSGGGDYTTVQSAIDSVPDGNADWIQITVKAGIYNEKVKIPRPKTFIFIKGEGIQRTVIQWGDFGSVAESSTFSLEADNFVASDISFTNTHPSTQSITWAPAALVYADKVSFYRCGFIGLQDTLYDVMGRHYYESCLIKGAIDFIFGLGQSMFKDCVLDVDGATLAGPGFITAQGRNSSDDPSAFVFNGGSIKGTGTMHLGRAYGPYSRVIFYKTNMDNVVVPEGWSSWNYGGKESTIAYSEEECSGPGADQSHRVPWMKKLRPGELAKFTDLKSFIDQDGWMENQPIHSS